MAAERPQNIRQNSSPIELFSRFFSLRQALEIRDDEIIGEYCVQQNQTLSLGAGLKFLAVFNATFQHRFNQFTWDVNKDKDSSIWSSNVTVWEFAIRWQEKSAKPHSRRSWRAVTISRNGNNQLPYYTYKPFNCDSAIRKPAALVSVCVFKMWDTHWFLTGNSRQ